MTHSYSFNAVNLIVGWIAGLFYFTALTSLIPFGALLVTSGVVSIPSQLRHLPLAALILVGVSILVLFLHYRNAAHTLAALGWMTFLPGLGGFFFLVFGKVAVFAWLEKIFEGSIAAPFISAVYKALPSAWLFVIGYILLGYALIGIAGRMDREHALFAQVRKLFGPRARILK